MLAEWFAGHGGLCGWACLWPAFLASIIWLSMPPSHTLQPHRKAGSLGSRGWLCHHYPHLGSEPSYWALPSQPSSPYRSGRFVGTPEIWAPSLKSRGRTEDEAWGQCFKGNRGQLGAESFEEPPWNSFLVTTSYRGN